MWVKRSEVAESLQVLADADSLTSRAVDEPLAQTGPSR